MNLHWRGYIFVNKEEKERDLGPGENKESGDELGKFNISYLRDTAAGSDWSDRPESDGLLMCVVIVICISANLYSDIYSLILP